MKNLSEEIRQACKTQYHRGNGVFPPIVCPYCYRCPIATLVTGIPGADYPLLIPDENVNEVETWLSKFN